MRKILKWRTDMQISTNRGFSCNFSKMGVSHLEIKYFRRLSHNIMVIKEYVKEVATNYLRN